MSDVTDLRDFVKTKFDTTDLKVVTNYRNTAATTINDTTLEAACQSAIYWTGSFFAEYDPTTYPMHKEIASHYAMYVLYVNTQQGDRAKTFKDTADQLLSPLLEQRAITPIAGSAYSPSSDDTGGGDRPPFDDSFFDGWGRD